MGALQQALGKEWHCVLGAPELSPFQEPESRFGELESLCLYSGDLIPSKDPSSARA